MVKLEDREYKALSNEVESQLFASGHLSNTDITHVESQRSRHLSKADKGSQGSIFLDLPKTLNPHNRDS